MVDAWWGQVASPWLWGVVGVALLLERRRPARPEHVGRKLGWLQDLVWLLLGGGLAVTVVAASVRDIDGWIPVLGSGRLLGSGPATAILAFVMADLCGWIAHYGFHRFRVLWVFHTVHHAPRQMTALSDRREHLVETLLSTAAVVVPARLLGLDAAGASVLAGITVAYGAFIHMNVQTDLGPLGHVLVSPQFHRVHHSVDPAHHDRNFGVVLSVWDRLFRTRVADRDLYPDTGVAYERYPHERRTSPVALLSTWVRQNAYPFVALLRREPATSSER